MKKILYVFAACLAVASAIETENREKKSEYIFGAFYGYLYDALKKLQCFRSLTWSPSKIYPVPLTMVVVMVPVLPALNAMTKEAKVQEIAHLGNFLYPSRVVNCFG